MIRFKVRKLDSKLDGSFNVHITLQLCNLRNLLSSSSVNSQFGHCNTKIHMPLKPRSSAGVSNLNTNRI